MNKQNSNKQKEKVICRVFFVTHSLLDGKPVFAVDFRYYGNDRTIQALAFNYSGMLMPARLLDQFLERVQVLLEEKSGKTVVFVSDPACPLEYLPEGCVYTDFGPGFYQAFRTKKENHSAVLQAEGRHSSAVSDDHSEPVQEAGRSDALGMAKGT